MKRVIGVYTKNTYPTSVYINDMVKECCLLFPSNMGRQAVERMVNDRRAACNNCIGCPMKERYGK